MHQKNVLSKSVASVIIDIIQNNNNIGIYKKKKTAFFPLGHQANDL